jgi:putative oxidoreductase
METIERLEPYVFSILRIMVGLLFMQHGLVKLFGFPTGAGFPAFLSLTWFEGCIEMIGGGLIVIGLFTRWAAFIMLRSLRFLSDPPVSSTSTRSKRRCVFTA